MFGFASAGVGFVARGEGQGGFGDLLEFVVAAARRPEAKYLQVSWRSTQHAQDKTARLPAGRWLVMLRAAKPNLMSVGKRSSPDASPVKVRPVLFVPLRPGARPSISVLTEAGPPGGYQVGTGALNQPG